MATIVKLPPAPAEIAVCRDMSVLAPGFRSRSEKLLARMEERGHPCFVAETFRTPERQRFLWGFGREYDDGRGVVTHSRDADETWHGFGLAVDIVHRGLWWDAPASFWRSLEEEAERLGLTSGADWDRDDSTRSQFKDLPHVQFGPPMRRSPSPRAARLRAAGGLPAVWAEVGAL
ncbi:MAG TPA: M15 family metallopeptidase [Gemmatimonadaceae bacterium]